MKMSTNLSKKSKEKSESECIINENIPEQKNGFVNGVVTHASGNKKNKKKKHKNSIKNTENSLGDKCKEKSIKRNEKDETSEESRRNDTVHSCDESIHFELVNNKLDSNENISESEKCRKLSPVPSCSTDAVLSEGNHQEMLDISNDLDKLELKCNATLSQPKIEFVQYQSEEQMPMIMKIIQKDLSEPYSIYTYRYFIHNWPNLCFLAMCEDQCVGAIVCKLDLHRKVIKRGYIAMLAVDQNYRKLRIGSTLVQMAIQEMIIGDADEVVLETEVTNKPALQLYEKLGFVRDKRLFRYYLNGVDALRLKLWLR